MNGIPATRFYMYTTLQSIFVLSSGTGQHTLLPRGTIPYNAHYLLRHRCAQLLRSWDCHRPTPAHSCLVASTNAAFGTLRSAFFPTTYFLLVLDGVCLKEPPLPTTYVVCSGLVVQLYNDARRPARHQLPVWHGWHLPRRWWRFRSDTMPDTWRAAVKLQTATLHLCRMFGTLLHFCC